MSHIRDDADHGEHFSIPSGHQLLADGVLSWPELLGGGLADDCHPELCTLVSELENPP